MGCCISSQPPLDAAVCGEWVSGTPSDIITLRSVMNGKEQCFSTAKEWIAGDIIKGTIMLVRDNGRIHFINANGKGTTFHYIGPASDWEGQTVKACCGGICFERQFDLATDSNGHEVLQLGKEHMLFKNSTPGFYDKVPQSQVRDSSSLKHVGENTILCGGLPELLVAE